MRTEKRDIHHDRHEQHQRRIAAQLAPSLIAAAVDGHPGGRDAAALGSMLASATAAELMLVSVYEEPLLESVLPAEKGWRTGRKQARTMLAHTRDSFAPNARIVVRSNSIAPRGLREIVRLEHRDLLILGSTRRAAEGRIGIGDT